MVSKGVASAIGNVIVIIILVVIGYVIFKQFVKTKEEQEAGEKFKERGLLGSIGDFFLGEPKGTETTNEDSKRQQEILTAQSELDEIQSKALVDQEKKIAELEKEVSDTQQLQVAPSFDRSSPELFEFQLDQPITSPTGKKVTSFAFFKTPSATKQEKLQRQTEAQAAAKKVGFTLSKDPFGRTRKLITATTPPKSEKLKRSLELSQQRRLGLREGSTILIGTTPEGKAKLQPTKKKFVPVDTSGKKVEISKTSKKAKAKATPKVKAKTRSQSLKEKGR